MPIVQVEMWEGRTEEQKRELTRRLTESVVDTLHVRPDQVIVLLREYATSHFTQGGTTTPTTPEPTER